MITKMVSKRTKQVPFTVLYHHIYLKMINWGQSAPSFYGF